MRNGSGYMDLTAYKAMQNYQKGEQEMQCFNRGEIFEYEQVGRGDIRKALIVSADFRKNDKYISVILLNEEPKGNINVPIVCQGQMYADCGMVSFAANDRLSNYLKTATAEEMAQIDEGIAKCLEIKMPKNVITFEKHHKELEELRNRLENCQLAEVKNNYVQELAAARAEAGIYKNLYEQLLAKMLG